MVFISSIHGQKPLLVFEEYLYREQSVLKNGSKRFRCSREETCLANVVITFENNVNIVSQHNHHPEPDKREAKKTLNKIKSRATTTMEEPRQVVMQYCPQSVSASLAVALPKLDAVRQTINYNRKKSLGVAKTTPLSRKDIQLPEIMTEAVENFLFHDSGFEENRMIVFATVKNLETMKDFQDWQIDGTFKVCPQLLFQRFTKHCNIYGSLVSIMYALLPNKTQESYGRLFALISHSKPKTVEVATQN